MKRHTRYSLLILLVTVLIMSFSAVLADGTNQTVIMTEKGKLIEQQLDTYAQTNSFSGTVLFAIDNEIVLAKGYGYANDETKTLNDINTVYEWASVTKQFTAAAIMHLVDQKKLSPNDTLDKFFPTFVHGSKITVKNLLQMRSGMSEFYDLASINFRKAGFKTADEFNQAISVDYEDAKKKQDVSDFVIKCANYMNLEYTPDEKYSYRNTNYILLSKIVEQLSGMSFSDYVTKNFFEPCGMSAANFRFKGVTAVGYYGEHGDRPALDKEYNNPVFTVGAGGINAGVLDLYRWNMAFHGGKIVSPESYAEMTAFVDGYGYGLRPEPNSPKTGFYHVGGSTCFNSANGVDLSKKYMIITVTNRQGTLNAAAMYKKIRELADAHIK